jgi:hypothetical protein
MPLSIGEKRGRITTLIGKVKSPSRQEEPGGWCPYCRRRRAILIPRFRLVSFGSVSPGAGFGTGSAISTIWPALVPDMQNLPGRGGSVP